MLFTQSLNSLSFHLNKASISECERIILNIKLTKTDINGIPEKTFKQIAKYISYPISKLINLTFKTSMYPDLFKVARITLNFKKAERENPANYRPISSLPYVGKIFERCIGDQIHSFNLVTDPIYVSEGKFNCDALVQFTETVYGSFKISCKCPHRSS